MREVKLGKLIDKNSLPYPGRDAVHVAIVPLVAGEILSPGQRFIIKEGMAYALEYQGDQPTGIVDPFLENPVWEDDHFYGCLFPGTITDLRHVWSHPSFAKKENPQ